MPPLLAAVYELLRQGGAYEMDQVDRWAWRGFWAFIVLLILTA